MKRAMPPDSILPLSLENRGELDKCVNCGLCQSVCPTYLTNNNESLTARGKIVLLKSMLDGKLEPSAKIADIFDNCLTCYACQTICPADVRTEKIWTSAREDLSRLSVKSKFKQQLLRFSIGKPAFLERLVRMASLAFGKDTSDHRQINYSKFGFKLDKRAPYLSSIIGVHSPAGDIRGRVGLLVGCSGNYLYPAAVDATIKLLNICGWEVIVPKCQVCCGAPAINNGNWELARSLAEINASVFNELELDAVLSPDATCSSAIIHDYRRIFFETPNDVVRLANATQDLGAFIAASLANFPIEFHNRHYCIALQDSCHATHYTGNNSWREVLSQIKGITIDETSNSSNCCGFGGSYALMHRDSSVIIGRAKIKSVRQHGGNELVACSPGCVVHLQSAANLEDDNNINVRHVAEIVADFLT
ncbi:(Fe-S)-binding protein [Calditrichota bacterium]